MHFGSLPTLFVWSLSTVFGLAGIINLVAPRTLREAYARWEYPRHFYIVTGTLEVLASLFLAIAETRIWGVVLGSLIVFVATITLLKNRHYAYAVPSMLLMAAFPAALLATPV